MKEVVGISFENGRIYYFDPNGHKIKENITVIVETEQGQQFGTVKIPLLKIDENKIKNPLKKIIRVSTKKDYMQYKKNKKEATLAKEKCQEISDKLKLNMKILDASYTFDRDKLLAFEQKFIISAFDVFKNIFIRFKIVVISFDFFFDVFFFLKIIIIII